MNISDRFPRLAAMAAGCVIFLTACTEPPPPPPPPPPPAPTNVATVKTFDMGTANAAEVRDALLRDRRVIIRGITFETDSAELLGAAYASVTRLGEIMTANPELKVAVVGHTDSTGAFEYNKALSERRAQSIVAALTKDFDIDPTRLGAVGVGELIPIETNDTDYGRSQNRRVELVVIDG